MCSVNIVPDESNRRALGIEPGTSVVELYTASQDKTVKVISTVEWHIAAFFFHCFLFKTVLVTPAMDVISM